MKLDLIQNEVDVIRKALNFYIDIQSKESRDIDVAKYLVEVINAKEVFDMEILKEKNGPAYLALPVSYRNYPKLFEFFWIKNILCIRRTTEYNKEFSTDWKACFVQDPLDHNRMVWSMSL